MICVLLGLEMHCYFHFLMTCTLLHLFLIRQSFYEGILKCIIFHWSFRPPQYNQHLIHHALPLYICRSVLGCNRINFAAHNRLPHAVPCITLFSINYMLLFQFFKIQYFDICSHSYIFLWTLYLVFMLSQDLHYWSLTGP